MGFLCRTHSNNCTQAAKWRLVRPTERVDTALPGGNNYPRDGGRGSGLAQQLVVDDDRLPGAESHATGRRQTTLLFAEVR